MVDPATMTGVSMAMSAGGSLLNAFGESKAGSAQADMLSYRAGLAQYRKKIALQNRDFAYEQGEEEAMRFGFKARQRAGAIKAAQGASGIDVGSGSPKAVREGQRRITEIDLGTIYDNAARRAYGFETEAAYEETQAALYDEAASRTRSATSMKVASSLLSGATAVSDKWLQASQSGVFGGGSTRFGSDTDPPIGL